MSYYKKCQDSLIIISTKSVLDEDQTKGIPSVSDILNKKVPIGDLIEIYYKTLKENPFLVILLTNILDIIFPNKIKEYVVSTQKFGIPTDTEGASEGSEYETDTEGESEYETDTEGASEGAPEVEVVIDDIDEEKLKHDKFIYQLLLVFILYNGSQFGKDKIVYGISVDYIIKCFRKELKEIIEIIGNKEDNKNNSKLINLLSIIPENYPIKEIFKKLIPKERKIRELKEFMRINILDAIKYFFPKTPSGIDHTYIHGTLSVILKKTILLRFFERLFVENSTLKPGEIKSVLNDIVIRNIIINNKDINEPNQSMIRRLFGELKEQVSTVGGRKKLYKELGLTGTERKVLNTRLQKLQKLQKSGYGKTIRFFKLI